MTPDNASAFTVNVTVPAGHPRQIRKLISTAVPFERWERRLGVVDGLEIFIPLVRFGGRHNHVVLDLKLARGGEAVGDRVSTSWEAILGRTSTWVRLIATRRAAQERQLVVLFELPRDRLLLEAIAHTGVCDLADMNEMVRVFPHRVSLQALLDGDLAPYAPSGANQRG